VLRDKWDSSLKNSKLFLVLCGGGKDNQDMLERGRQVLEKKEFNPYIGFVFEDLRGILNRETGRWWHRDKEIDLVALNEESKEIGFFEVKWASLSQREAIKSWRN
ncbi:MAG TPA: hypothetical protein ENG12_00430, partial [Candidatus Altiarchaeales archaeon]|nr:hypothetical protein [Candidatus Altiarchaeales archaeon]